MATLRITLFDSEFQVIDTVDVPVAKGIQLGPGAATKAAKTHYWENHFEADLEPIMATRENLILHLKDCLTNLERLVKFIKDTNVYLARENITAVRIPEYTSDLEGAKAALVESDMLSDQALPEAYREKLKQRLNRKRA